jgi:cardiolipin synthase A/B
MHLTSAIVAALLYLLSITICIVALFVVPTNRKPSSATAWLMLIFGLPYCARCCRAAPDSRTTTI